MLYLVYCFVKYKRILQTAEVLSVINIENKLKKYYIEKLDFPDNINLFIKYLGTVCENRYTEFLRNSSIEVWNDSINFTIYDKGLFGIDNKLKKQIKSNFNYYTLISGIFSDVVYFEVNK